MKAEQETYVVLKHAQIRKSTASRLLSRSKDFSEAGILSYYGVLMVSTDELVS